MKRRVLASTIARKSCRTEPAPLPPLPINAPATNTLRIKACNVGPATQSVTDLPIRYISFR